MATAALAAFATACLAQPTLRDIQAKIAQNLDHLPTVLALVNEKVRIPGGGSTSRSPRTTTWGMSDGDRSYLWAMKGRAVFYEAQEVVSSRDDLRLYNRHLYKDGKEYTILFNKAGEKLHAGQGNFGKFRGSIPLPSNFAFRIDAFWLDEFLGNVKVEKISQPENGPITLTGSNERGGSFTIRLRPDRGYAMEYCDLINPDQRTGVTWETDEFQEVKGGWFPVKMKVAFFAIPDKQRANQKEVSLEVKEFKEDIPKETFDTAWIEGSRVQDKDTGYNYYFRNGKLIADPNNGKSKIPMMLTGLVSIGLFATLGSLLIGRLVVPAIAKQMREGQT